MCLAQLQAVSQAGPSLNRPGQAKPNGWPEDGFGLAYNFGKPKPVAQAGQAMITNLGE